jgi:hypothetical protein
VRVGGGLSAPTIGRSATRAYRQLRFDIALLPERLIGATTHLFEQPGALEQVADLACQWFQTGAENDGRGFFQLPLSEVLT